MSAPKSTPARGGASGDGAGQRKLTDASKDAPEFVVHRLLSREFRQYPSGVFGVTKDGQPYPILAGRAEVTAVTKLRDVGPDLAPAALVDTTFHVTYTSPDGDTERCAVSERDMRSRDPEWPTALGIGGQVPDGTTKTVSNLVRAMGQTVQREAGWQHAYASTGLLRLPDRPPVFLRYGAPALTATNVDPSLTCELPPGVGELPGVRALSLDDPSTAATLGDDFEALLRILDTCPDQPFIPLAMLAHLAWAPWSTIPEFGRVPLMVAGDTGRMKTALSGLIIAAQSRTYVGGPGQEVPVTVKMRHAGSSTIGVDRVLYPLAGMVAVVDDFFAGQLSPKEAAAEWTRLSALGDNATTGSGGAKGSRQGVGVRADRYPRCNPLGNGEGLPGEADRGSEVGRFSAMILESDVDTAVLSEVQASARETSRAHSAMIRRGLADLNAPARALAWAREQVERWDVGGHNRARQGYVKLLGGVYLLGEQHRHALEMDPAAFLDDAADLLRGAADDQARRCGMTAGGQTARDPVRLFTRAFVEMIGGDPWWLATPDVERIGMETGNATYAHRPPAIPGHSPAALGWRQLGDTGEARWNPGGRGAPLGSVRVHDGKGGRPPWRPVMLSIPANRWESIADQVTKYVRDRWGWSLPASDMLRRKLADEGWLRESSSDEVWTGAGKVRVIKFDLGRLLNGGEDQGDGDGDQGDGGELPDDDGPAGDDDARQLPLALAEEYPDAAPTVAALAGEVSTDTMRALVGGIGARVTGDVLESGNKADSTDAPAEPAESPAEPPAPVPAPIAPEPTRPAESGATGRRAGRFGRAGMLTTAGLHLPGATGPIAAPAPASEAEAYALGEAHGLTQVWVMPDVAGALGLPELTGGAKGAGIVHPWADLTGTGLTADPSGAVSRWVNVWQADGDRRTTGRAVVFPHLDDDWANDMPNAATLADALPLFAQALGTGWYMGAPILARQLAGDANKRRRGGQLGPCEAIRAEEVPELAAYKATGTNLVRSISRPLTGAEDMSLYLHKFDRNGSEPAVFESVRLGIGEPVHLTGDAAAYVPERDRKRAGYWRTAGPITGLDPRLAALLRLDDGDGGGVLLTSPECALFADLGVLPPTVEARVWPESKEILRAVGERFRKARVTLAGQNTPAGRVALRMVKGVANALVGVLAEQARTGERRDWLWRPDWRHHIKAQAQANMVRELIEVGKATDRYPMAAHVDAVIYASDTANPTDALPPGMTLATVGGGAWKPEGHALVAALRSECGERTFRLAWLRETGKGE